MNIRFDVYFQQNIGTLYKDNEIDTQGREGKVNLDLSQVNSIIVNFKVGDTSITDTVIIKNIEERLIQIPFKNSVIKQGLNNFEIEATMKNGDVKVSQTYCYHIEKSLENENSLVAETNYPILIQLLADVQIAKDAEVIRIANEQARQTLKDELLLLKTNLESLQSDLNSLDSAITTNENTRQSNETERELLKTSLEGLQVALNSLENNVTANESIRESNEANRILEATNKVKEINDKIIDVEVRTIAKESDIENKIINVEARCVAKENLIDSKITNVEARTVAKETLVNNKIAEANATISNVNIAKDNTVIATNNATNKITETEATRQSIITTINNLVAQFNALAPASSTNAEVQLARTDITGKTYASLQERLLADNKQQNILYSSVSGTYINSDSVDGYAKNIVIEGNTYQNPSVLSDIKSTGTKLSDNRFEIPLLCTNKNLLNPNDLDIKKQSLLMSNGSFNVSTGMDTTGFIKVKTGQQIVCSGGVNVWYGGFYDKNKVWKKVIQTSPFTVDEDGYYRVSFDNTKYSTIQIEFGSVATSFESYKEHKVTILSDVQIEKVGTVADRIIQASDEVWDIEKNVKRKNLKDMVIAKGITTDGFTNYHIANLGAKDTGKVDDIICKGLSNSQSTKPRVQKYTNGTEGVLILDSVLFDTVEKVKEWINNNDIYILIIGATPTYIPLSDNQQIALRTFNNKTNILSLCEIEPTIKCDIPKSTSASISSINEKLSNVDKDLARVKKLEDATTISVINDTGFCNIVDSTNGYLSDIKLEGKTLVNLLPKKDKFIGSSATGVPLTTRVYKNTIIRKLDTSKYYTLIIKFSDLNGGVDVSICDSNQANSAFYTRVTSNGYFVVKFKPTNDIGNMLWIWNIADTNLTYTIEDAMILEGDYTSNPPNGYIEGIKSVGQDVDKLVVSSVKADGNLFDGTWTIGKGLILETGVEYANSVRNTTTYVSVNSSQSYCVTGATTVMVCYYDYLFKFVSAQSTGFSKLTVPTNAKYCKISIDNAVDYSKFVVNKGTTPITYRPYETDKKEISYLDTVDSTWKKPVFRGIWSNGSLVVGDVAEKKSDGKYSYRKRMSEVVLNGSESWSIQDKGNVLQGLLIYPNLASNVISDKFKFSPLNDTEECIWIYNKDRIVLNINKSKLTTQDVAGFKAWLSTNLVTVVYELAQEQVYECTPIDLASYDSETNYLVECGVLSPRSTIKCTNFIGNIINNLKEKVSIAENTNQLIMMMLLNHEARLKLHNI